MTELGTGRQLGIKVQADSAREPAACAVASVKRVRECGCPFHLAKTDALVAFDPLWDSAIVLDVSER
jgi:hypothetical protein